MRWSTIITFNDVLVEYHDSDIAARPLLANSAEIVRLCAAFGRRRWLFGDAASVHHHVQLFTLDPEPFRDPPLAEGVMILAGIGGLLARARIESRWKYAHGFWLSFAFAIVVYGAWWWTEVMYNQGVIHAYPTL